MQDKFDELSDPDPPEGWVREYSPDLQLSGLTPSTLDVVFTKNSKTIEVWCGDDGVWWCGAYEILVPKEKAAIIEWGKREKAIESAQILMEWENTL